jgi:hypothetical protein
MSDAAVKDAEWLSVTEAASVCRVSERTVHRWIGAGTIQTRLSDTGRREVERASLPVSDAGTHGAARASDTLSDVTDASSDTSDASDTAQRRVRQATDSASDVTDTRRLEGYRLAVRVATQRLREARDEVTWLRGQNERLLTQIEAAREAETQLRLMLATATTRPALAATAEPDATSPSSGRRWLASPRARWLAISAAIAVLATAGTWAAMHRSSRRHAPRQVLAPTPNAQHPTPALLRAPAALALRPEKPPAKPHP